MNPISIVIRSLRIHKNLSQKYVAFKLGLSQSQYSKMENSEKEFPIGKLVIFSTLVGLEPSRMLELIGKALTNPEEATQKAFAYISNQVYDGKSSEDNRLEEYKILAHFFEEKYLSLYRE